MVIAQSLNGLLCNFTLSTDTAPPIQLFDWNTNAFYYNPVEVRRSALRPACLDVPCCSPQVGVYSRQFYGEIYEIRAFAASEGEREARMPRVSASERAVRAQRCPRASTPALASKPVKAFARRPFSRAPSSASRRSTRATSGRSSTPLPFRCSRNAPPGRDHHSSSGCAQNYFSDPAYCVLSYVSLEGPDADQVRARRWR
jgi:hypothetical protein